MVKALPIRDGEERFAGVEVYRDDTLLLSLDVYEALNLQNDKTVNEDVRAVVSGVLEACR